MKRVLTNSITTGVAFPVKSGTLEHIQNAYYEGLQHMALGLIGPTYAINTVYILWGMVATVNGNSWSIGSGAVYYNGEIYQFNAGTYDVVAPNLLVASIGTGNITGPTFDPVLFTDGVSRSVHQVRSLALISGLAGSGIANYNDFKRIYTNIAPVTLTQAGIVQITGAYPNFTINVPDPGNKILRSGEIRIGDINSPAQLDGNTSLLSGGSQNFAQYRYIFPNAAPHANFIPVVTVHNDNLDNGPEFNPNFSVSVQIGKTTATDMYLAVQIDTAAGSNVQDITLKYLLISTV